MFIPGFILHSIGIPFFWVMMAPGIFWGIVVLRFLCRSLNIPVAKVSYFRLGVPSGMIDYGPVLNLKDVYLIACVPLIVNTILCSLFTFPCIFFNFIIDSESNILFLLLFWLGFSFGLVPFCARDYNLKYFLPEIKKANLSLPVFLPAIFIATILSILQNPLGGLIYAIGVSMFLPWLIGAL